jgi:hypothetical protein
MRIEAQKYEFSFIWSKNPSFYQWRDCEPCDIWGKPFSEWDERQREDFEEVQPIPDGPYLTSIYPRVRDYPYDPLENAILFAQFADIAPDKESFAEWANDYGRLIDVDRKYLFMHILVPDDHFTQKEAESIKKAADRRIIEKNERFYFLGKPDPLRFWIEEHRDLSFNVMLWEMALNDDPRLNKIVEHHEDTERVYIYKFPKEKLNEIDFKRFREDDAYSPNFIKPPYRLERYFQRGFDAQKAALRYVQDSINRKLESYPLRVSFQTGENEELHKVIEPTSLLSFMWYQFYLALAGEIQLRRCSLCGKWENMEGHRSTWTKHANCANYGRVRRARLKKRGELEED